MQTKTPLQSKGFVGNSVTMFFSIFQMLADFTGMDIPSEIDMEFQTSMIVFVITLLNLINRIITKTQLSFKKEG